MRLMQNIDFSHSETQCLFMDNKVNYFEKSLQIMNDIKDLPKKPTLLMHVCCGPCSTYPLTLLCPLFDVTLMFNNSNIYPKEEHDKRLNELKKLLDYYKRDYGFDIKLIEAPYDNENYNVDLEPYKDLPEGQIRCFICYEKRMDQAYKYADENGFDYFTSVMSISRYKNATKINEIGEKLSYKYKHTKYFYSDFKKKNGEQLGKALTRKYDLYDQQYCGCKYTYEDYLRRNENESN